MQPQRPVMAKLSRAAYGVSSVSPYSLPPDTPKISGLFQITVLGVLGEVFPRTSNRSPNRSLGVNSGPGG